MAVAETDIGPVDARGRDPDQDIGGAQDRHRYLPHLEDVGIAEPVELDRFHWSSPVLGARVAAAIAEAVMAAGKPA